MRARRPSLCVAVLDDGERKVAIECRRDNVERYRRMVEAGMKLFEPRHRGLRKRRRRTPAPPLPP